MATEGLKSPVVLSLFNKGEAQKGDSDHLASILPIPNLAFWGCLGEGS